MTVRDIRFVNDFYNDTVEITSLNNTGVRYNSWDEVPEEELDKEVFSVRAIGWDWGVASLKLIVEEIR